MNAFHVSALIVCGAWSLASAQIFDEETLKARAAAVRDEDAQATVVVYNEADRDSAALARFYAGKRNIPKDHVLGLKCSREEEITRAEYDRNIAAPLRKIFEKKGWWDLRVGEHPLGRVEKSTIRFVALMRGIPLKIRQPDEAYPGDEVVGQPEIAGHAEAAVDSELAVLGVYTRRISGALNNPYFRSFTPIKTASMPALLLVCRLDAPTPEIVRQMINDSLATEQQGLRGFAYIDARGIGDPGLKLGDTWLTNVAQSARKNGSPVIFDNVEGMFPVTYPMRSTALYFGWYAGDVAGPFTRPDFRFQRGAVAVHIHSFSAQSLRDPKKFWCAPLLAAGAAATLGNVYEPYLGLTPALDIFHDRLRAGFTFAESAYMSQRFLSWMTTFIGDPLYRPFKSGGEIPIAKARDDWDAYAAGARTWFRDGPGAGTAALEAVAKGRKSGVVFEGLGLLQVAASDAKPAVGNFASAAKCYTQPEDIMRVTIHEALQLEALNRVPDALSLTRRRLAMFPATPAAELLRLIEAGMAPAPPKNANPAAPPR